MSNSSSLVKHISLVFCRGLCNESDSIVSSNVLLGLVDVVLYWSNY